MHLTPILSVDQLMVQQPVMVSPRDTVREVIRLMNERRIGAALVGESGRLVGIFTERDVLKHASTAPLGWDQNPVSEWMTRDPWTIGPQASWEQAMSLMETLHVRHVPVVDEGRVIGVLSARDLMLQYGEYLARVVEERTRELRQANERLQERDRELRLHMAVAGRLQERLLTIGPPNWPEVQWEAHYAPLDPLGGDYYDFAQPDGTHLGMLIADASGHSIPAAMVAIMARTAFTNAAKTSVRPADVLAAMNRDLHGLTEEHFVTAFYGVFDCHSRLFTYANAGQPAPLHLRSASQVCTPLHLQGLMLGIDPHTRYDEELIRIEPGDKLLFYTDGVSDCMNEAGTPFGQERLLEYVHAHGSETVPTLVQRLADALAAYRGAAPQRDDITILAAEIRGCGA